MLRSRSGLLILIECLSVRVSLLFIIRETSVIIFGNVLNKFSHANL